MFESSHFGGLQEPITSKNLEWQSLLSNQRLFVLSLIRAYSDRIVEQGVSSTEDFISRSGATIVKNPRRFNHGRSVFIEDAFVYPEAAEFRWHQGAISPSAELCTFSQKLQTIVDGLLALNKISTGCIDILEYFELRSAMLFPECEAFIKNNHTRKLLEIDNSFDTQHENEKKLVVGMAKRMAEEMINNSANERQVTEEFESRFISGEKKLVNIDGAICLLVKVRKKSLKVGRFSGKHEDDEVYGLDENRTSTSFILLVKNTLSERPTLLFKSFDHLQNKAHYSKLEKMEDVGIADWMLRLAA